MFGTIEKHNYPSGISISIPHTLKLIVIYLNFPSFSLVIAFDTKNSFSKFGGIIDSFVLTYYDKQVHVLDFLVEFLSLYHSFWSQSQLFIGFLLTTITYSLNLLFRVIWMLSRNTRPRRSIQDSTRTFDLDLTFTLDLKPKWNMKFRTQISNSWPTSESKPKNKLINWDMTLNLDNRFRTWI